MGGVATAIRKDEAGYVLKIAEGNEHTDEFIITRHAQFVQPINIINIYGMQEGRNSKEKIEEGWKVILDHVDKFQKEGEETIILGDLNRLIGNGEYGVKSNNPKVTFGGSLILDLLKTENFLLLNSSESCVGGPFTRIDPSNEAIKSCLDLCIISIGLKKYFEKMIIDKEHLFTPHRATGNRLIFTDHLSLHIKFKEIPEVSKCYQKAGKLVS